MRILGTGRYLISYTGLRMDKASLVRQGAVGANKNIVRDALAKDFDLVIEGSTNKPQTAVYIQPTQALKSLKTID